MPLFGHGLRGQLKSGGCDEHDAQLRPASGLRRDPRRPVRPAAGCSGYLNGAMVSKQGRIVILGGGFGGVLAAKHLERIFGTSKDVEIASSSMRQASRGFRTPGSTPMGR